MKSLHSVLLITSLLLSLSSIHVKAQTIGKFEDNRWTYDSKVYKYSELESILGQNSKAKTYYNIALQKGKASKGWGYAAGGSAALGVLTLVLNKEPQSCRSNDFFSVSIGCAIDSGTQNIVPVFLLGIITPITGIISLTLNGKSNKYKKMSVDSFNEDISSLKPKKQSNQLSLVVSDRIGLQLRF
tara:strand:- start:1503 stop:2057 length:555 start_codon:yes stop_codon:yes gene_type:complete